MDREVDARWERFKASLAQHLKTVPCKASAPLDKYYDAAKKVLNTAERYEETNNQRSTYMFYYRFASLCVHTIASHPRYHDRLFREEKIWAIEETKKAMNELENIKASMRESWKADLLDRERRASERAAEEEERKRKEKQRIEKEKIKADSETKIESPPKLDSPISKSDSTYLDAMRSLNIGSNLYPVKSETEYNTPPSPTQRSPADAAASSSKRKSGIYPVLEEPSSKSKPTTSSSSSLYPSLDELNNKSHPPKPPSYDNVEMKKSKNNLPPPSYDDISSGVAKNKKKEKNIVSVRIPPNTRPGQMLQVRDPETGRIFKISVPLNHPCRPGDVIQVRIPSQKQQHQPPQHTSSRGTTSSSISPQRPPGRFHSPKEILDAPRGFSLLPSYKTHPIRSTATGFRHQSLISSKRPLNVTPLTGFRSLLCHSLYQADHLQQVTPSKVHSFLLH